MHTNFYTRCEYIFHNQIFNRTNEAIGILHVFYCADYTIVYWPSSNLTTLVYYYCADYTIV